MTETVITPALQVIETLDGSCTIFVPGLNEHYHSIFGAVQESRHVFLEAGLLDPWGRTPVTEPLEVFEVGFGTGLNALLACLTAGTRHRRMHYTTIELHPLDREVWERLNYPEILGSPEAAGWFRQIHEAPWERPCSVNPCFTLDKIHGDLLSTSLPARSFHVILFDAFAPEVQPALWTGEVFERMYLLLQQGGRLVTYSSKGEVNRNLKRAGFRTEKLPGPPGKREILRAWKS